MTEYHYQKLDVWQKAVDFSLEILAATAQLPESAGFSALIQDLANSSTNIAASIAQGKAYTSRQDFTHHLYASRGSVYKTMTLLEILRRKKMMKDGRFADLDNIAQQLTGMLSGLIKSVNKPKSDNPESRATKWR
jgi:four helix bundle protein